MMTVKYLEDIVATLQAIDDTYNERPMKAVQVSISKGQPILENKDIPTRQVLEKKFKILPDSVNRRIQNLVDKGLIEVDPQRSYQGYKAFQRVYRLTGKGLQMLMLNS